MALGFPHSLPPDPSDHPRRDILGMHLADHPADVSFRIDGEKEKL
jgi:hypothetical protein